MHNVNSTGLSRTQKIKIKIISKESFDANIPLTKCVRFKIQMLISPDIIPFTVSLPVSYETRAVLVKKLTALLTLKTSCMPLQIRSDPEDVLVMNLTTTSDTVTQSSWFFCKEGKYFVKKIVMMSLMVFRRQKVNI